MNYVSTTDTHNFEERPMAIYSLLYISALALLVIIAKDDLTPALCPHTEG
jgi:hypothetical protein